MLTHSGCKDLGIRKYLFVANNTIPLRKTSKKCALTVRTASFLKKNINQKGINSSTKFVNYNTTKHFDEMDNYSSIPTSESKIINFYI